MYQQKGDTYSASKVGRGYKEDYQRKIQLASELVYRDGLGSEKEYKGCKRGGAFVFLLFSFCFSFSLKVSILRSFICFITKGQSFL